MPTASTTNKPASAAQYKELGCFWQRTSQGKNEKYLTGVINFKEIPGFPDKDIPVVVFKNKRKEKDSHPDLRIYLSEKKPTAAADKPAPATAAAAQTAPVAASDSIL